MSKTISSPPGDVAIEARCLALVWPDGSRGTYPFTWLRDSCACTSCRHPGSGQRLLEPAAIAPDVHPAEMRLDGDELLVTWAPDGHPSVYSGEWLRGAGDAPVAGAPRTWDASIARDLPLADHAAVTSDDPRQLRRWLQRSRRSSAAPTPTRRSGCGDGTTSARSPA